VAARIAAEAFQSAASASRSCATAPRGLLWLEPLVEVDTPAGRIGFGPVDAGDVPALFDAGFQVPARTGTRWRWDWSKRFPTWRASSA
jgi:formate dehydrogenase iron-sulfur subunit